MATADHIAAALVALEEEATEFEILIDAFDSINPDSPPAWLAVMLSRFLPLKDRIETLGDVVRRDVLPLHRDMDSLARSKGGMGAVAPMVTKVVDSQSINSRK
jgi:hypothetical protein